MLEGDLEELQRCRKMLAVHCQPRQHESVHELPKAYLCARLSERERERETERDRDRDRERERERDRDRQRQTERETTRIPFRARVPFARDAHA